MNATPPPNSLQVVCAIITNSKNEILACQRNSMTSLPGKWEFPGGKIETNESKKSAIIREIKEELGVTIEVEREDSPVLYQYPSFHISLYPFHCKIISNVEPQALEHAQIKWISWADASHLDWSEADRVILAKN